MKTALSQSRLSFVLPLGMIVLVCGCSREQRTLRNMPPMRSYPTATVPNSHIQPGGTFPVPPGGVSGRTVHNPYEGNAYAISEGRQFYVMYNCIGCHMNGGGDIGPPLINAKYRYGDSPSEIYKTIVYGRPHGMPAWGARIPEYQIWELVTYVLSMRGSEPSSATPARNDSMQRTREQTE